MKSIKLSIIAMLSIGTFSYAGGDLSVVTPYEEEDVVLAEEAYVEPEPVVQEEYVEPYVEPVKEVYVAPTPVVQERVVSDKKIAASGFYAGLGISGTRYKPNCNCAGNTDSKKAGVMARVGYDFNKYIGIEARGIATNLKSNGDGVQHAGLFVKPMVPVSDSTNIYGLVGVAKTKTKGTMPKTNASSLALGVGIEVDVSSDTPKEGRYNRPFDGKGDQEKGLGVFADYERMVVKSGAPDLDAVSAGITYDF